MNLSKQELLDLLNEKSLRHFGCYLDEASHQQIYKTVCLVIRDILSKKRKLKWLGSFWFLHLLHSPEGQLWNSSCQLLIQQQAFSLKGTVNYTWGFHLFDHFLNSPSEECFMSFLFQSHPYAPKLIVPLNTSSKKLTTLIKQQFIPEIIT